MVPVGSYEVTAVQEGYKEKSVYRVRVEAGDRRQLRFGLERFNPQKRRLLHGGSVACVGATVFPAIPVHLMRLVGIEEMRTPSNVLLAVGGVGCVAIIASKFLGGTADKPKPISIKRQQP